MVFTVNGRVEIGMGGGIDAMRFGIGSGTDEPVDMETEGDGGDGGDGEDAMEISNGNGDMDVNSSVSFSSSLAVISFDPASSSTTAVVTGIDTSFWTSAASNNCSNSAFTLASLSSV